MIIAGDKNGLDPSDESAAGESVPPDTEEDLDESPSDEASVEDWVQAEHARPTLPDETEDGLDDLDEEVRHQAEDQPLDTPGRLR